MKIVRIVFVYLSVVLSSPAFSEDVAPKTLGTILSASTIKTNQARDDLKNIVFDNINKDPNDQISIEIEKKVFDFNLQVERDCAIKLIVLEDQLSKYNRKEAHANAYGALITLIGGVTVYAPAKAVLMGIGISSAGGSNSVLGGLAMSLGENATLSQQHIDSLKKEYSSSMQKYRDIDKENDKHGLKRLDILAMAQAGCDGLTTVTEIPKP